MSHKITKRIRQLENKHRRDMVRLKSEILSAVTVMLDEAKLPIIEPTTYWDVDAIRSRKIVFPDGEMTLGDAQAAGRRIE